MSVVARTFWRDREIELPNGAGDGRGPWAISPAASWRFVAELRKVNEGRGCWSCSFIMFDRSKTSLKHYCLLLIHGIALTFHTQQCNSAACRFPMMGRPIDSQLAVPQKQRSMMPAVKQYYPAQKRLGIVPNPSQ
jgi:hypothetical protein